MRLHGRRQAVDNGTGRGHAGGADRLVKPGRTLGEIADRIGRAKISGLCFAGSDQMSGCKIRPLYIVDQNAVAREQFQNRRPEGQQGSEDLKIGFNLRLPFLFRAG